MLLMGLMRNVAITGSTDSINAWFGQRQGGRWAVRTVAAAMPTVAVRATIADVERAAGARRHHRRRVRAAALPRQARRVKNSSARLVLVCCSAVVLTPRAARNARVSAATWNDSVGAHLVESSRIRESSG